MILERKKLVWTLFNWDESDDPFLCREELGNLFSIPDVSKIWVSIRDHPTAFSMAIQIRRKRAGVEWVVTTENGRSWGQWKLFSGLRRILNKYIGRTVYLEVEYEPEGTSDADSTT